MNNTFALKDTQTYALLTVPAVLSFFLFLIQRKSITYRKREHLWKVIKKKRKTSLHSVFYTGCLHVVTIMTF